MKNVSKKLFLCNVFFLAALLYYLMCGIFLLENSESHLFWFFVELLYLPLVFGTPILAAAMVFILLKRGRRNFQSNLSLTLSLFILILFGSKLYLYYAKGVTLY